MKLDKKPLGIFGVLTLVGINTFGFVLTDTIRLKPIAIPKENKFPKPLTIIKTSPTAALWGGVFPFTAEYRLMVELSGSKKQSEQLSLSLLGKSLLLKILEKTTQQTSNQLFKVSGWRIQYAHKFYVLNKKRTAPFGFYVAPLLSYTNAHIALGLKRYYLNSYIDFRHFNANLICGLQLGKKNRATFDIYAGAGYKSNKVFYHFSSNTLVPINTADFGYLYNSHLNLVFGINIGYAFN